MVGLWWPTLTTALIAYLFGSGVIGFEFPNLFAVIVCAIKTGVCDLLGLVLAWFVPQIDAAFYLLPASSFNFAWVETLLGLFHLLSYWCPIHEAAGVIAAYVPFKCIILAVRFVKRWIPTLG